ncbi:hypothetical protein GX830_01010 [Candidatus Dojkabacteria bacterium]|nr:hypothetical protein [Candidatus Dojkabacteria bacterium]
MPHKDLKRRREYMRGYRERNREYYKEYQREYKEKNKERLKAHREENKEKIKKYREGKKEYFKKYQKENREELNSYRNRWRKENPFKIRAYEYKRKMRANGMPLSKGRITKTMEVRIATKLQEQDFKCLYCGVNIEKDFTLDHIIPLSRGGSNDISNIDLVCRSCNSSKSTKTKEEYLEVLGKEKGEHQEQRVLMLG